ncbi:hypothetical protein TrST_g11021 [Triparma strigata]|uniref:Uncharacterized protein n=1 Tax=Triparma strigata TaxID=1606541 RepID=A0A9W6ZK17_9STRA|nr:hypothetical protein TrST_g11021 [Triparma strigata]
MKVHEGNDISKEDAEAQEELKRQNCQAQRKLSCRNSACNFKDVILKAIRGKMGEEEALLMVRDLLKEKVEELGGNGGGSGSGGGGKA